MATNMIIRNVDESLHRALKVMAAEQGKTLQGLIKEILQQEIDRRMK